MALDEKGIKIILLGETGVGKTNLMRVFMGEKFEINTLATLTCYSFYGKFEYNKEFYKYSLWDTAGQERYRALNKMFVRDAKIIILVYSIIDRNSFVQLDFWLKFTKENKGDDNYIIGLVGNKTDLFEVETVTDDEGQKYASDNKLDYELTSAKLNPAGFKNFANKLIAEYINTFILHNNNIGQNQKKDNIKLNNKNKDDKEKKKCC